MPASSKEATQATKETDNQHLHIERSPQQITATELSELINIADNDDEENTLDSGNAKQSSKGSSLFPGSWLINTGNDST